MLAFEALDLLITVNQTSDSVLDEAPFGIVRMDRDSRVSLYNQWEAKLSGLSPGRVVGKLFFTEIAPCTNNYLVALRYQEEATLDICLDYVFSYRMRPVPVRLRLLKAEAGPRWLMVTRRDG
jgi:photoactive yellow protein